jgi:hypothetical protein
MRNAHERALPAPAARVGALLDRLAGPDDLLWPAPAWPALRLDRPLGVGASGGHGPVRYRVSEYEPGRRVRFTFDPAIGLEGYHELRVVPDGADRCRLVHVLEGRPHGSALLSWPLAVRWLHDGLIEDALDNAELAVTGTVARPARRSAWQRFLRARLAVRPREAQVTGPLISAALPRVDFADAWSVPLVDGVTSDPAEWAREVFMTTPAWVSALMGLRNALGRLVGIERGDRSAFAVTERTDNEALLGIDAKHLDFRASLLVDRRRVTLATVAQLHNARGRLYMAIVKRVHPAIVRSMLAQGSRRLAERAPAAGAITPR